MSPEATSRGVVGTLARGRALKTDARTRTARGRSVSSSLAPEPDGVKRGVPRAETEPTGVVRSRLSKVCTEAVTVEWTVQDGEVRKPVTGEALTGAAELGGVAEGERSEAEGMSWAMSPEAASGAGVGRLPPGTEHDAKVGGRSGPKVVGRPTSPSGIG